MIRVSWSRLIKPAVKTLLSPPLLGWRTLMHLEFNHYVSCLHRFICKADMKLWLWWWWCRMWLQIAAEATWYLWRQIIPSGGTLYQPVAMVTSQGHVLTQALPPGTIQIQNSQVKQSGRWRLGRHFRSLLALSPEFVNNNRASIHLTETPPRHLFIVYV